MPQMTWKFMVAAVLSGLLLGFLGAVASSRLGLLGEASAIPAETSPAVTEGETESPVVPAVEAMEALPLPEPSPPETSYPVMVSVCGAVKRAATYRFGRDQRVNDAIRAAGGLAPDADLDNINVAARLMDNTTLYIPFKVFSQQEGRALVARRTPTAVEMNPARYTRSGWVEAGGETVVQAPPTESPAETAPREKVAASDGRINLNSASLQELQELPGIGPKTAEKIIAYRESNPFARIDDLMEVHGIGEKKMEAVRNLVTVE